MKNKKIVRLSLVSVLLQSLSLFALPATTNSGSAALTNLIKRFKDSPKNAPIAAYAGRRITVSEPELNAYLAQLAQEKGKGRVKTAEVVFLGDKRISLKAMGRIEWAQVFKSQKDSWAAKLLASLGGVESSMNATVETASAKGKGYLHVLSVKVNGIELPQALVGELLHHIGEKQRPQLDFSGLFVLPYGIQKIEIKKQAAVLYF